MTTMLLNATITWLCSLAVYELLLKKETFHRLNRFYLLLTFMAGIVLSLLPWGQSVYITTLKTDGTVAQPFVQTATQMIAATTAETGIQNTGISWWPIIYSTGVAISVLYLLRDLLRLRVLYRGATLQKEGRWLIAETGKGHSPFSFLHIIFVSSRDQYTEQQWQMVVQHEQQHFHSRHILDLALMQIAVILLWFHPLAYIYRYKLRLLHEYEVDSLQEHDIQTYGMFLLEQAALTPPPVMTHSFSFSPLKNRIHMMTRSTSRRRTQCRLFLLLPMLSLFVWCCKNNRTKVTIDIKDRFAVRHDVHLEYSPAPPVDTILIESPDGQTVMSTIVSEPYPEKLNGRKILWPEELMALPKCKDPGVEFGIRYLIEKAGLEKTLQKMADGNYFMAISDIIVDSSGRIVYYMMTFPENQTGLTTDAQGFNHAKPNGFTESDKKEIQQKISAALIGGNILFTPGKNKQGAPAPYFLESENRNLRSFKLSSQMIVKNHQFTYKE